MTIFPTYPQQQRTAKTHLPTQLLKQKQILLLLHKDEKTRRNIKRDFLAWNLHKILMSMKSFRRAFERYFQWLVKKTKKQKEFCQ